MKSDLGLAVIVIGAGAALVWWMSRNRSLGSGYVRQAMVTPDMDAMFYGTEPDPSLLALVSRPQVQPQRIQAQQDGQTAQRLTSAGVSVGTSAASVGLGLTSGTALAMTGIGAGAGLLTWGILDQGWFRGGEEGVKVNPNRDRFLSQFGDPSNKDVGGAGHNLASQLTAWGIGAGGGQPFVNLQRADTMDAFVPTTRAIQAIYAQHGQSIFAF